MNIQNEGKLPPAAAKNEDLIQMCSQQSNIDSNEINFDLTTYTTSPLFAPLYQTKTLYISTFEKISTNYDKIDHFEYYSSSF